MSVKDVVMPEKLRMDAYYYGFRSTGVREIDQLLSAVAMAGKTYHSTDQWIDPTYAVDLEYGGEISPEELIQEMADRAAEKFRGLSECL